MKTSHKIAFVFAAILAITSLGISLYFWGKLPDIIPTHFGISGQPDDWNPKSVWYSFLMPVLQIIMLGSFIFLYYKPQYSDMPTTLWLMTIDEKHREHAFDLIRTMLVGVSLWIGLLFTYITYMMNYSAINKDSGLVPWIMLGILGAMILWLTFWTIKVYKATKEAMQELKSQK